jgi:hypothetical protein
VVKSVTSLASIPPPTGHPSNITLYQNYPNPFNPTTTIGFTLSALSRVSLIVYNTLGQEVAQLIDGELGTGTHEVTFNAGRLASGTYYYRLRAGAFVQTKAMLLIR